MQGNPGFPKHTLKSKSKEIVVRRISKLNNYNSKVNGFLLHLKI